MWHTERDKSLKQALHTLNDAGLEKKAMTEHCTPKQGRYCQEQASCSKDTEWPSKTKSRSFQHSQANTQTHRDHAAKGKSPREHRPFVSQLIVVALVLRSRGLARRLSSMTASSVEQLAK